MISSPCRLGAFTCCVLVLVSAGCGGGASPATQTPTKTATVTSLSASLVTPTVGQAVVLTASVPSATSGSGSITFFDGATTLGSAVPVNGQATMNTSSLVTGKHALSAAYSGDASTLGSTSPTITVTVVPLPPSPPPSPTCADTWGTPDQRPTIDAAFATGSLTSAVNAIRAAAATRGNHVGCPNVNVYYSTPNYSEPTTATVAGIWSAVHAPGLTSYRQGCAWPGHDWPGVTLAGYYATAAGQTVDIVAQHNILNMLLATQYNTANASLNPRLTAGAFGQLNVSTSDPCYESGTTDAVRTWCAAEPQSCVVYNGGLYAGQSFRVEDIDASASNFDGGLQFDQGWAVVAMIEAARVEPDANLKQSYLAAAQAGAQWCIAEQPVSNTNYNAKCVWALADLYAMTGTTTWRDAMLDKVQRSMEPSLLMDLDTDGIVDGQTSQQFNGLWTTAQVPGRAWDGHNSRGTYSGINALALAEVYVALRDRGDATSAAAVRPYAMAMLDNLSAEILTSGVSNSGLQDILSAFAVGLRKIALYEGLNKPAWQQAAAAEWNTGANNLFSNTAVTGGIGYNSVQTALYLLYKSGVAYKPGITP